MYHVLFTNCVLLRHCFICFCLINFFLLFDLCFFFLCKSKTIKETEKSHLPDKFFFFFFFTPFLFPSQSSVFPNNITKAIPQQSIGSRIGSHLPCPIGAAISSIQIYTTAWQLIYTDANTPPLSALRLVKIL